MRATVQQKRRHDIYLISDASGQFLASTAMSRGGAFTISSTLVSKMAHDLCLTVDQMVGVVRCPLSRTDALAAIVHNQQHKA